jgi:predicted double-glycine peptidase
MMQDIPSIAAHFDIIDTYLTKAKQIGKIKHLNPSFKAIFYKHALSYRGGSEDWYAHDAHTWAILKQTN